MFDMNSPERIREKQKEMEEFKIKFRNLPDNVRNAIMVAQQKKKHSDFFYKMKHLNDKIHAFTSIFYNNEPSYQKIWN